MSKNLLRLKCQVGNRDRMLVIQEAVPVVVLTISVEEEVVNQTVIVSFSSYYAIIDRKCFS